MRKKGEDDGQGEILEELWLLRGGSRGVCLDEVEEGANLGARRR
jgi:hypothetical protein